MEYSANVETSVINTLYHHFVFTLNFLVVTFHTGVYWPLLGVWQIQSCCLAVGRMLKFSAPILTQERYCTYTFKNIFVQRWHNSICKAMLVCLHS